MPLTEEGLGLLQTEMENVMDLLDKTEGSEERFSEAVWKQILTVDPEIEAWAEIVAEINTEIDYFIVNG